MIKKYYSNYTGKQIDEAVSAIVDNSVKPEDLTQEVWDDITEIATTVSDEMVDIVEEKLNEDIVNLRRQINNISLDSLKAQEKITSNNKLSYTLIDPVIYTAAQVESRLAEFKGAFQFKGKKNSIESLPTASVDNIGHVYIVDDFEYASNGEKWIQLGQNGDFVLDSVYQTHLNAQNEVNKLQSKTNQNLVNVDSNLQQQINETNKKINSNIDIWSKQTQVDKSAINGNITVDNKEIKVYDDSRIETNINNNQKNISDLSKQLINLNYAGSNTPGGAAKSANKLNKKLTINGTEFDGSTDIDIDITPSNIGASAVGHNHDKTYSKLGHNHDSLYAPIQHTHAYLPTSGGTVEGHLNSFTYTLTDANKNSHLHIEHNNDQININIGSPLYIQNNSGTHICKLSENELFMPDNFNIKIGDNNLVKQNDLNDIYLSLTNKNNELNNKIENETIKQYNVDTYDYGVYNSIAYDILKHKEVGTYLYNKQYLATKIDSGYNTFNIVVENLLDKEKYSIYDISDTFSDSPSRLELILTPSPQEEITLTNRDNIFGTLSYSRVGDEFGLWSNTTDGSLGLGNLANDGAYLYAYDFSEQGDNKYISFGSWLKSSDNYSNEIPILFDLWEGSPSIILKGGTKITNSDISTESYSIESTEATYGWIGYGYNDNELGLYASSRHPITLYDTDVDVDYLYCYHNDNDNLYVMFGGALTPESYENPIMFDIDYYNPAIYVKDRNIIEELDNINAKLENLPVFESEVSTNSYSQIVPNNALDYALVEEIGGMTYESENLIVLEDIEETTINGITYSIKNGIITLNGASTLTDSSFEIITANLAALPNGDYSLGVYGMITDAYAISCGIYSESHSLLLNVNRDNNQRGGTFNGDPKWLGIAISTQANFTNHKFCLKLVKGTTVPTINLSLFENGYTGFYNAKVTSINFTQRNLLPIRPRVIYDGTGSSGVYCELDKDGWYTLTKTGTSSKSLNFMTSSTNIPAGVYSFRVVFKDLYGQKIGTNIGSFVGIYNVIGDNTENRAFTISYDGNRYGYALQDVTLSYPLKNLYVWLSESLIINEPVTFKVELVKGSFMNDSIIIPNEVQALEGYGLGIDNGTDNYNYIRYNEDTEQYEFVKNVASYTFTGNENFYQGGTHISIGKVRFGYSGLRDIIQKVSSAGVKGIIKTELLNTTTVTGTYMGTNAISVDTLGDIYWFIDNIQTLEEFRTYITGKTIIYKLATPEVIDISSYMNDEYLQLQENGIVEFVNEKQKIVPNKITYAIKVV